MELNEIVEKLGILVEEHNPKSIYQTGKDRAFKASKFYELDIMRKSLLATIQKSYPDLSAVKAETEALSHETYKNHLIKMIQSKLEEELAINKHEYNKLLFNYLEKRLSLIQSQMKCR